MISYREHIIKANSPIKEALAQLDQLSADAILFIVDENDRLMGALTDGDVRRGFINGLTLEDVVDKFSQPEPKFLQKGNYSVHDVIHFRENDLKVIPVLCRDGKIVNIINFRFHKSYLPVDAVVMAGGRGQRLKPLTDTIPKPLLKVGEKPIAEHNIDRLASYGIDDFWISVKYLGEQIQDYFKDGSRKNINIQYVWEDDPLGTIGAVSKIPHFEHDYILVTNSDLLTNLDYEHFFLHFLEHEADLAVVTIPYQVSIPYGVLETDNGFIKSFKEKPTYTYFSNGGIYLLKKSILEYLPKDGFYNATDLIEKLIEEKLNVISYPLVGYWLDVGKHEDFEKAQMDINQIKF